MTRISGHSRLHSISRVQKSSHRKTAALDNFKLAKRSLEDLTDAPLPPPNAAEWLEYWEDEIKSYAALPEDESVQIKPEKNIDSNKKTLKGHLNTYLFANINKTAATVLPNLSVALNTDTVSEAATKVDSLLDNKRPDYWADMPEDKETDTSLFAYLKKIIINKN